MKIEKYDNVYILMKEGNYFWNELFSTPENVYIQFIYEEHFNKYKHLSTFDYFDSDDKINKVKIIIDKPTYPCQTCTYNNHVSFTKLRIMRDSTVEFRMIDFVENIEINNNLCPGGSAQSIFTLINDNSRLFLLESTCYISCSPFINVLYSNPGKIFFGHTHFYKNEKSNKNKIFVVGANRGWNWGGKANIHSSFSNLDNFCVLYDEKNKNIESYMDL
jgi:hypothetical protein